MGIPDHLACLLRNLYAGQEATVTTRHGTMDLLKIGKAVCEVCLAKAMIFPLVIYGCEIKTIKRVEN